MPGEYSHEHPITIHQGPMADKRGTGWRDDAAKLEALNQRRIENPMQSLPNDLKSIDKERQFAKSDGGTLDFNFEVGGDKIDTTR